MNMHTKITTATATLAQLHPGQEYPGGNINARLTYTDQEIDELAASLKGPDGQLRPLLVATHSKKPGVFFVFGGGRRRIAFERLIAAGDLPKDHPIEIVSHGEITPDQALSRSYADNQAVPMHPADQAATFAKLAADKAPEDIARDRGMTVQAVKQSIALGTALAPEVLAAWRAGKLTRDEVEVFTLASDFEAQASALSDSWGFKNGRDIDKRELRRKFMRNKEPEMKRLLGFVGVEAARAFGIEITEDFFGGGGVVKDMKGLHKMAKAKMEGIVANLEQQGWSWVETQMAPNHMHHGHGQIQVKPEYAADEKKLLAEIKAQLKATQDADGDYAMEEKLEAEREKIENAAQFRSFNDKQKAKSGVIVSLTNEGAITYQGGLIRKNAPKAKAKPGAAPAAKEPPKPVIPDIDRDVDNLLDEWRDQAVAELIAAKPKEAVALFLAGVCANWSSPIEWNDLDNHSDKISTSRKFAAVFDQMRKLPLDKLAAKLAVLVGGVASVHAYHGGGGDKANADLVMGVMGEKNYQALLVKKFDPKAYVAGASKQHMLGILAEAEGEESRKAHEKDGQASLNLPVITAIKATGWLPPQLRTKLYAGPTAKKPAKKAKR